MNKYISPEFEIIKIELTNDVLAQSTATEATVTEIIVTQPSEWETLPDL